ncbi:bacteriocin biosynthesis docking scaffold, SagD family [Anoxybacillus flavithermus TNO-09.006]|uniref:YcaO-like family protein n=1 Tax=Anoxybacillus flavithermus TaxID=33934 RepID=UPI0002A726D2|nr:YcaO-like family protein [Anoxybacillus flavithermus]ELK21790.1 bacteriocin biosynthesis docking scaffold, SagD family [Anoxybacillus flavithermus TNO-09.006]
MKEAGVYRSLFQNAPKKVFIRPSLLEGAHGGATHFEISRVIKAALGEYIERTSLYLNLGNFKQKTVHALNLVTLKTIEIPLKRVLLCYNAKVFDGDLEEGIDYNDSCGVASHVSSFRAVNNAFLEFFERQCFVHNWLTQSSGREIRQETITSELLKELIYKAKQFVDDVFFFDISLHNNLYVILTLGFGKQYMAIGLSSHWNLEEAMCKSLEEWFQFFGGKVSKYYLYEKNNIDYKMAHREYKSNSNYVHYDPCYYSNYFFSTFTPSKLKESFGYLFERSISIDYREQSNHRSVSFTNCIKEISEDLQLDILCVFIPCVLENVPAKIVKVLSENGYPHMLTQWLNPRDYVFSRVFNQKEFPNEGKPIPFP